MAMAQTMWREPLVLEGSLHETIWGGRALETVAGKRLPPDADVGESWETAVASVVRTGTHAGMRLGDVVRAGGEAVIGQRASAIYGRRFPLLTKFIDAHDWLSVQVHPDDAYAAAHEGGKLGKTELWYVLRAEPGARLACGLAREASAAEVRAAVVEQRLDDLLRTFEAQPGDVVFVPAGTIHAIGGGIVLYELQEYSDVTYRLYDYGRLQANGQQRELHLDRALAVMRYTPCHAPRAATVHVPSGPGLARRILCACQYFAAEEITLSGTLAASTAPASCEILVVLEGVCSLQSEGGEASLSLGDTAVLPAALGPYSLAGQGARLIRSYVPVQDDPALDLWRHAQPADPLA